MNRKQIAHILNDTYKVYAEGDAVTTLEDNLSNIVDFGRTLTSSATIGDLMSGVGNLIDKVRQTIFIDTEFISTAPPCFVDTTTFNGLKEVVRVDSLGFTNSLEFDCVTPSSATVEGVTVTSPYTNQNTFDKLFGKVLPTISAKYYNQSTPYEQKITITNDQFISAFNSPADMERLFGMIQSRLKERREFAKDMLSYYAFDSAVLDVATRRASKSMVALDDTSTETIIAQLNGIARNLTVYNNAYSDDTFVSSIRRNDLVVAIRGDLYDSIITSLASVYHDEKLAFPFDNIVPLPYFQTPSDTDCVTGITPNTTSGKYGTVDNIAAVIYDKRVCGCTFDREVVTAQPIANERCTNYFHLADMSYIVNSDLPMVIITENGSTDFSETSITTS